MKKITLLTLLACLTLSSFSQNKFGYIDSQELLMLMPERKTAETEVQEFAKSLEAQLASMTAELQASYEEYQANESTYTDFEIGRVLLFTNITESISFLRICTKDSNTL